MTSTLHALDHASRFVEIVADGRLSAQPARADYDLHAAELCKLVMRAAQAVGGSITSETAFSAQAPSIGWHVLPKIAKALAEIEGAAKELDALQRAHRAAILASVAQGKLTAADALARIDFARRLDRIAHHAWRSAAHLLGQAA